MKPTIVILALLLASPAWAVPQCGGSDDNGGSCTSDPANWHLLTQSYGGMVSLIKGITEKECRFMRHRALGEPATNDEQSDEELRNKLLEENAKDECSKHSSEKYYSDGNIGCWNGHVSSYAVPYRGRWGYIMQIGDIKTAECFQ